MTLQWVEIHQGITKFVGFKYGLPYFPRLSAGSQVSTWSQMSPESKVTVFQM